MSANLKIDPLDRKILDALQMDGRLSNRDLAEKINLSESPCLRRLRLMEQSGAISHYAAVLDEKVMGLTFSAWVQITLDRQAKDTVERFEEMIAEVPEVMDMYLVTGSFDYLLRVLTTDLAAFEQLLRHKLLRMPYVAHLQTNVVMNHVMKRRTLPI
jgi:Lrp/AsnC family leucine-responsive transcriptional regulator